ncbi:hypothetical protein WT23_20435 [Burkholderia territorii]|nr:hypothetical protein WT23_20435 [Burkholderia territorii]
MVDVDSRLMLVDNDVINELFPPSLVDSDEMLDIVDVDRLLIAWKAVFNCEPFTASVLVAVT